ncbi:iron chaperone [Ramlibacter sp. WS9]|uniref:iron chaperone n=1 Tax=Ramlibacter sp. WS9 TaxID=1882741 RepID=UPI001144EEC4|nr:DUF1801 domain-containing protein [Ramlibacter sp. WS9]ROZ75378.1 DUF1801 domain-containing protein [Ramlibacter sp. WS9]
MTSRPHFSTVDEYIAAADPKAREILQTIRKIVSAAVPDATECISYQMPALRHKKVFFYFAAFKKHIGVYPPVQDHALATNLARYRGPKGNLQFQLDEPIPYDLIARVAQSLARQYAAAAK